MTVLAKLGVVADLISSNVDKKTREGELPVRLINYTDVYYGSVLTPDLEYMPATATSGQIERVGVKDGDVIFTKDSEASDDIGIPALVREPGEDMVCGYHLTIARPRRSLVESNYLYWYLCSAVVKSYWEQTANGVTRFSIGYSATSALPIALPPIERQRAIADYLERETAEIDAMSADLDEMEKLLQERRGTYISDRVRASLSPCKRVSLQSVASIHAGKSIAAAQVTNDGEYPVYGGNGIRGYTSEFNELQDRILIGRQGALCGNVHLARGPFFASEHALVVNPHIDIDIEWLAYVLHDQDLGQLSMSAAQPGITASGVGMQKIDMPSIDEQRRVVDEIDRETAEIDAMLADITELRDLLAERRAAVIAAAVTGQIDIPVAEETTHA